MWLSWGKASGVSDKVSMKKSGFSYNCLMLLMSMVEDVELVMMLLMYFS